MKKDNKDAINPQVQVLTAHWNKEKRYDENHSYFLSNKKHSCVKRDMAHYVCDSYNVNRLYAKVIQLFVRGAICR